MNTELKPPSVWRSATFTADKDSIIGEWQITCADCPLAKHFVAVKQKPAPCVSGIQTNVQGFVPMKTCEYYVENSLKNERKKLSLECRHVEP